MKLADIPELRDASISTKLGLVDELWAEIVSVSSTLPLPDWHLREIDRSLTEYSANPREGRPWAEIRDQLLGKKP